MTETEPVEAALQSEMIVSTPVTVSGVGGLAGVGAPSFKTQIRLPSGSRSMWVGRWPTAICFSQRGSLAHRIKRDGLIEASHVHEDVVFPRGGHISGTLEKRLKLDRQAYFPNRYVR
ncbi:MAG: hypothetical protein MPW16_20915 (plasmid) [Candidatus Manganitrophus sp.]|nr:MAG: hypothetical protein MPW16_20915 [Candidatus Manganitrophus sp.]